MIALKFRKYPYLCSKKLFNKAYANMLRGIYRQEHEKELKMVENMIDDIDYRALQRLSYIFHTPPDLILFHYFSWLGMGKEYLIITSDEAERILKII